MAEPTSNINGKPSTVYSFINVRNPNVFRPENLKNELITEELVFDTSSSSVLTSINSILYGESTDHEKASEIISTAQSYLTGNKFKTIFEIDELFPFFQEMSDTINLGYDKNGNEIVDVKSYILNQTESTTLSELYQLDSVDFIRVWNLHLCYSIIKDTNNFIGKLVMVIRFFNLLAYLIEKDVTGPAKELRRYINAPIVLPEPLPVNLTKLSKEGSSEEEESEVEVGNIYGLLLKVIETAQEYFTRTKNAYLKQRPAKPKVPTDFGEEDSVWDDYLKDIEEWQDDFFQKLKFSSFSEAPDLEEALNELKQTEKGETIHKRFFDETSFDRFMEILKFETEKEYRIQSEKNQNISYAVRIGNNVEIIKVPANSTNEVNFLENLWNNLLNNYPECTVKPLGIGDYLKVEQQLKAYKAGEIAHIENIMMGETRVRKTRSLDRTERFDYLEEETTEETEKDLQTTSKGEMESSIDEVTQTSLNMAAGVNISGTYGLMTINADTNVNYNNYNQTATHNAEKHAQEVVEKARQKIVKRKKTINSVTKIIEFVEENEHSFTNPAIPTTPEGGTGSTGGVNNVGLYRWVDKYYLHRLMNYGPHLIMEFFVPEPAKNYKYSKVYKSIAGAESLKKPSEPMVWNNESSLLTTPSQILDWNYSYLGRELGVAIAPPPSGYIFLAKTLSLLPGAGDMPNSIVDETLEIPEGYELDSYRISLHGMSVHPGYPMGSPNNENGEWVWAEIYLNGKGTAWISGSMRMYNGFWEYADGEIWNNTHGEVPIEGKLQIGALVKCKTYASAKIEIRLRRKQEHFDKWRQKIFEDLWSAYYLKLEDYNNQLRQIQMRESLQTNFGQNPTLNREIEKIELKKSCLHLFSKTGLGQMDAYPNDGNSNAGNKDPKCNPPIFDNCNVIQNGPMVEFLEKAFEWDNLTYELYPYYYAKRCSWIDLLNVTDNDPKFQQFLQSGAARILVPVTPGREREVLYYLQSGTKWNGEDAPAIFNTHYLSLIKEIETRYDPELTWPVPVQKLSKNGAAMEDIVWETKLPTNLVILNCESSCLMKGQDEIVGYSREELDAALNNSIH